ncbi:MAG: Uma2 family endonuclease [Desulfotomaculum sp.]|nr:Uma2 family endonuclease [Desulfotomaculum sp.]MCL0080683.1 Uma2 family endonuclease [Peptococcaceae bacterium]
MTMANPQIKFTYQDYCLMPEDKRYELMGGKFFVTPSPSVIHQRAAANLEAILRDFVRQNDLGEVLDAPLDVLLSPYDVVQPDIIFISRKRSSIVTEANIKGAPDLLVEVLSPSTRERDRTTKKKLYANHGVRELWLVNPMSQTIEVFDLESDPAGTAPRFYTRLAKEAVTSLVLDGLEVDLQEVF